MSKKIAQKYITSNPSVEPMPFLAPSEPKIHLQPRAQGRAANTTTFSAITSWNRLTGSENIYGMLVSNSRPLQYHDDLGRVSFVHRKSHTYQANPLPSATASTGVITADITNDWGLVWDSTALWSNNTFWARYPGGGIYSAPGNTNAAQAFIVGTGPVTIAGGGWEGNWFASKRIDTVHGANFNNNVPTGLGNQFISSASTPTVGNTGKVDFARLDFSAPDNGKLHVIGRIMEDADGTTFATQLTRGARVLTATLNTTSNTFDWSGDSVIPQTIVASDGHKMMIGEPHMAWSEDGNIGYVFFIGCRAGATGNNKGNQPIVFKKTPSTPWTPITGIDFNSPSMDPVTKHIPPVSESNSLTIPFFSTTEGIDGIVDGNGKLHIMATVQGTSSDNDDSLNFSFQFPNSLDGETYGFSHTPGMRPYIYDFVGDGTSAWTVMTIDSMGSEGPGSNAAGDDGFTNNPWDISPETGSKVGIDARMQMSRTPDGNYIVYTWAESDSVTSNNGVKWNYNPNLHARLLKINGGTMTLHPTELNITDPVNLADANIEVRGFAYNHYTSPKCALSTNSNPNNVAIFLPMTVSNNPPIHQLEPINHYYSSAVLNFDNLSVVNPPAAPDGDADPNFPTSIASNALKSAQNSIIFPNPAKGSAVLNIELRSTSHVNMSIMNLVGQEVRSAEVSGQLGQNHITVDLSGLSKGIYMVNVKVGNAVSTKKLVVE